MQVYFSTPNFPSLDYSLSFRLDTYIILRNTYNYIKLQKITLQNTDVYHTHQRNTTTKVDKNRQ